MLGFISLFLFLFETFGARAREHARKHALMQTLAHAHTCVCAGTHVCKHAHARAHVRA